MLDKRKVAMFSAILLVVLASAVGIVAAYEGFNSTTTSTIEGSTISTSTYTVNGTLTEVIITEYIVYVTIVNSTTTVTSQSNTTCTQWSNETTIIC